MHHPPVTEYDLHGLPLTAEIIEQHLAKTEARVTRLEKKRTPVALTDKAVLFETAYFAETLLASEAQRERCAALKARITELPTLET
jgi:hypothetical protein